MESFFSFLERRVDDCSSLLCVGLDPHVDALSSPTAEAAREYCLRLVRATAPYAAAFKPNAAFFEVFGAEGWEALKAVVEGIHMESERQGSHIPVILDAKRGDIASTAEAYARSAFEMLGAHAITLSPYLGQDSIEPFVRNSEKGAFLLCKTSNPGSGDLQDLSVHTRLGKPVPLHVHVAGLARQWNSLGNIGLVVGATFPEILRDIRSAAPDLWLLAPGVGAQSGDLGAALQAGLRADRKGILINVSRGISRAANPGQAAAEYRDTILEHQGQTAVAIGAHQRAGSLAGLADALLETRCVRFGEFTLKSGMISPIYIDLRRVVSYPRLLDQIASSYLAILKDLTFDHLAPVPFAAIPIATAIALQGNYPMIYPRKDAKSYGTRVEIEGEYQAGETAVLIDDLTTTGESKFEAIEKLKAAGLQVRDVVVLIDRQSGAREKLQHAGYRMQAVTTITDLLDQWEKKGQVGQDRIQAAREFIGRQA